MSLCKATTPGGRRCAPHLLAQRIATHGIEITTVGLPFASHIQTLSGDTQPRALHRIMPLCRGRLAPVAGEKRPHQRPPQLRRVALVGDEVLQQVVAGELGCVHPVVAVKHLSVAPGRSAGTEK